MQFAAINSDFSYWQKQTKPLFPDLVWNFPEQKTGKISIVGGNQQGFSTIIRTAEHLLQTFPLKDVSILLPDALRGQVPPLSNLNFAPSTTSGSFAKSFDLNQAFRNTEFSLVLGDLSKNSATAIALTEAITTSFDQNHPVLLTRDAVDLLAPSSSELLNYPHLFLVASMAQLQKVFRAVYYPKMLMLSQPLIPVIETLHKFTLTYPVTLLTFHQGQIIVAKGGDITTTDLTMTDFSPISLWSGQLAARIAAFNLYNPNHPLAATTAAILFR